MVVRDSVGTNIALCIGTQLRLRGAVVRVRVERLVRDDVVLEQSLEVLFAVLGEEEGVDAWAEFLEGEVGRREEGAAGCGRVGEVLDQACLAESEEQGAEVAGEEFEDLEGLRRWNQDAVYAVDETIGGALWMCE